jgi:hypothetical protein
MIRVAVEIREHAVVRRVRVTAESIERALELCEGDARVVFPIEPGPFFAKDTTGSVEEQSTGTSEPRAKLAA